MPEKLKQWVYKAHNDTGIVVKPTTLTGQYGNQGQLIQTIQNAPIKLHFTGCHCVVNADFARRNHIDLDDLIKVIEAYPHYGTHFWCIDSPEMNVEVSEKIKKEIKDTRISKRKVIHGPRT